MGCANTFSHCKLSSGGHLNKFRSEGDADSWQISCGAKKSRVKVDRRNFFLWPRGGATQKGHYRTHADCDKSLSGQKKIVKKVWYDKNANIEKRKENLSLLNFDLGVRL